MRELGWGRKEHFWPEYIPLYWHRPGYTDDRLRSTEIDRWSTWTDQSILDDLGRYIPTMPYCIYNFQSISGSSALTHRSSSQQHRHSYNENVRSQQRTCVSSTRSMDHVYPTKMKPSLLVINAVRLICVTMM